jgi:hypothetical protein
MMLPHSTPFEKYFHSNYIPEPYEQEDIGRLCDKPLRQIRRLDTVTFLVSEY